MVYYGKPSKACSLCRARKIKCDLLRPACSQCVRVGAECPGYRNPLDLLFRDQRQDVEQRVHWRAAQSLTTENNRNARERDILERVDSTIVPTSYKPQLFRSISLSVREIANPLFFHYFAVEDRASGHALLSCLPETISAAEDDALSAAVSSVGYALFSNITNSSNMLIVARQKYGIAVRLTRMALQNSIELDTSYILPAILLLAIFEVLTCKNPQSMTAWSSHVEGAATLLGTRGLDISNCTLDGAGKGLKLFSQLRDKILVNCMQRNLAVPDAISRWSYKLKYLQTSDELLSAEVGDITIRLANLRAAIASKDYFDCDQYVSLLLQMDYDLEKWASALPSSWSYEIHACVPQGNFYTMSYHKYPGFSIATVWNQYRTVRCLVNDLLLTCLSPSRSSNSSFDHIFMLERRNRAEDTIRNLCTDVCVSVPYFLGQMDQNDLPRPGVGALEVMWALFVSACMRCISETQRLWALVQLDKIGHELGVRKALSAALLIRLKAKLVEFRGGYDLDGENCILNNTWYEDPETEPLF